MKEIMTDYQCKLILKLILDILDSVNSLEEAKEKVKALLDE